MFSLSTESAAAGAPAPTPFVSPSYISTGRYTRGPVTVTVNLNTLRTAEAEEVRRARLSTKAKDKAREKEILDGGSAGSSPVLGRGKITRIYVAGSGGGAPSAAAAAAPRSSGPANPALQAPPPPLAIPTPSAGGRFPPGSPSPSSPGMVFPFNSAQLNAAVGANPLRSLGEEPCCCGFKTKNVATLVALAVGELITYWIAAENSNKDNFGTYMGVGTAVSALAAGVVRCILIRCC